MPASLEGLIAKLFGPEKPSDSRVKAWQGADRRHDMTLPPDVRNSRENELLDHYSVGADLGPVMGPILGVAQEAVGRPLLSRYPDLANDLLPSVFNFKTEANQRPGAVDPYTKPTLSDASTNLASTVSGSLDQYPQLQSLLGLTQQETMGGKAPAPSPSPAQGDGIMAMIKKILSQRTR
jgi:hypothetical protein